MSARMMIIRLILIKYNFFIEFCFQITKIKTIRNRAIRNLFNVSREKPTNQL